MRYYARPLEGAVPREEWLDISLVYWRPGKTYKSIDKLPEKFRSLVRRSRGSGSRYLVYAYTYLPDGTEVYGYSRCMDIDNPERAYGRNKAIGWLTKHLQPHGYTVIRED